MEKSQTLVSHQFLLKMWILSALLSLILTRPLYSLYTPACRRYLQCSEHCPRLLWLLFCLQCLPQLCCMSKSFKIQTKSFPLMLSLLVPILSPLNTVNIYTRSLKWPNFYCTLNFTYLCFIPGKLEHFKYYAC